MYPNKNHLFTGRLSTNSSIPEDAIFDPNDPEERRHKQDWSKTTLDKDTWAHQERRRLSGWSNSEYLFFHFLYTRKLYPRTPKLYSFSEIKS